MWQEFREFAVKGNAVDMAVGIIIGAAFGAIVTALVEGVIMPPIGVMIGGVDFSDLFLLIREGARPGPYASLADAQEAGAAVISYGVLINTLISFIIVAFAVFLLVKGINSLRRAQAAEATDTPAEPELTTDQQLLQEIRDLLRTRPTL